MSRNKDYNSFLISPDNPDTVKETIEALRKNGIKVNYSMEYDFKNVRNAFGKKDGNHYFERAKNNYVYGGQLLSLNNRGKLLQWVKIHEESAKKIDGCEMIKKEPISEHWYIDDLDHEFKTHPAFNRKISDLEKEELNKYRVSDSDEFIKISSDEFVHIFLGSDGMGICRRKLIPAKNIATWRAIEEDKDVKNEK